MAILQVKLYGNPVLRRETAPVEALTPDVERLIADMTDTMYGTGNGVGLAAPQVGRLERIYIADVAYLIGRDGNEDATGEHELQVFINPEIVEEGDEDTMTAEGCLSLPEIEGDVFRPTSILLRARNERFEPIEVELEGFPAVCAQHEIDHLNGILFIDRMSRIKRMKLAGKLALLRRRGRAQSEEPVAVEIDQSEVEAV